MKKAGCESHFNHFCSWLYEETCGETIYEKQDSHPAACQLYRNINRSIWLWKPGDDDVSSSRSFTITPATGDCNWNLNSFTPLAAKSGLPPVQLRISDIGLSADVVEMAWQVSKEKGQRSVQWQVPLNQAGWHVNSAKPGSAGNVDHLWSSSNG